MRQRIKTYRDGWSRVALWSVIGLGALLAYLHHNPIELSSEDREMPGTLITLDAVSDFLLVVDYDNMNPAPDAFESIDFSLAWLNTLQQEVGPVALIDAPSIPERDLGRYRVVVLTRSAASNSSWLPKLKGYVDRGGVLILEMPTGALREAFSADGQGGLRAPQRITQAVGLEADALSALEPLQLSTITRLIGSAGPLDKAETLMTMDGVPVVYRKRLGAGWVITVDFDYGMLLTAIQQGRPIEGFRVRNVRGSSAIETADLAIQEELVTSTVPIADLIERFMVYGVIDLCYPVIGFWPFLDGSDGAFVVTHDERGMGDRAAWMAEHESGFSASSSYFIRLPGTVTGDGLNYLTSLGVDVALEWDRDLDGGGAYRPLGLLGIQPLRKALTLAEQGDLLRERATDLPHLLTVRSRDHLWGRAWTQPFRIMAAYDLRADASYAPPPGTVGYAFGTGLPFMPLDDNGLAFNLLEFPTLLVATGAEQEAEILAQVLRNSQLNDHQAVTISFAPDSFRHQPSAALFETWRSAYRIAAENGHWITSVRNLFRFSRARHNSEIHSHRTELQVERRNLHVVRLETLALESGMHLSVPQAIGERTFSAARRGLSRAQGQELLTEQLSTRPVTVSGFQRILVPLSKGFNAIDVLYD